MHDTNITPELFRRASGLWATGVSIVTTVDDAGTPFGLTMNAVTSLSLNPPLFIVCVDNGSDTLAPITASRVFCVNVLTRAQQDLSNRFAKKGSEKFADIAHHRGASGAPVLADTLVSIECKVTAIVAGGDHQIMCGEVQAITTSEDPSARPLLYFGGRYAELAAG